MTPTTSGFTRPGTEGGTGGERRERGRSEWTFRTRDNEGFAVGVTVRTRTERGDEPCEEGVYWSVECGTEGV